MGDEEIYNMKIQNGVIATKHVFAKNNRVFLKKDTPENVDNIVWFPINFHWIAVVELNNTLNHQSNHRL